MIRVATYFIVIFPFVSAALCGAEATSPGEEETQSTIERINARYDDFFRRQRELQKRDEQRAQKAGEVKRQRRERQEILEEARASYVKSRKKAVEDPRLEKRWLAQDKEWVERNKMARARYVQKKQAVENIQKRGRRIPGNQEYDLED